ncbi:MAG: thiamine pyrophosphate-dependent dehydrogenase E1 component subunit alpha [Candidatus Pacebacteria bacterium]|nr:thiamine pyrophosphate-dependent dehydrogenase E1 component subunit alpha [Candidatus Paceibacterota bacterium]
MKKSDLIKFYKQMLLIRRFEEKTGELILKGEIKTPCHLCIGQEAVAVGVCSALDKQDYVFSNHRGHGHYLAKGGDIKKLMAEIFCKETGCSYGRGGSMHIIAREQGFMGSAPIVAGTVSLALGAALALKIKMEKRVSVSFFGDGATGEGVLYESLNFSALKKLPLIFVCENNLYSTHLPIRECRPDIGIFKIAQPFGIKAFQIDGNDVLKIYETAKKAKKMCLVSKGPVFIECLTYRQSGHVGPNDRIQSENKDIRPKREVEAWKKKDPVKRIRNLIIDKKVLESQKLEKIEKEIEKEVEEAYKFAKSSPICKKEEINKYVFNQE